MQKTLYTMLIVSLLILIQGCGLGIFEDLSKCPQGVNFSFYHQTPCENEPSYPTTIKQVQIFAFNDKNILIDEFSADDIHISADYLLKTPFYQVGEFSFIAWGGENLDSYKFTDFKKGISRKKDILISLERKFNNIDQHPHRLYYSSTEMLKIEDREHLGSFYDLISFNMQELTNRLKFTILGLTEHDNYSVVIRDNNSVYKLDGDFAPDTSFDYTSTITRDGDKLKIDFVLLKLAEKRDTRLIIHNTSTNKEVYNINLVDDLIMYSKEFGKPPYSLECDSDFDIQIKFEAYILVQAIINEWNLVTRPVTLGK